MKITIKHIHSLTIGISIIIAFVVMISLNRCTPKETNQMISESKTETEIKIEIEVDSSLYTVQIGVFSKEVPISTFDNISSVNVKKTNNGLYKYSFGIYESKEEAEDSKKQIVEYGISDAFVVVYEVGTLYTQNEMELLQNEMTPIQTEFSSPEMELKALTELKDLKYKVELGSYFEDIPSEDAMAILEISNSDYQIDRHKSANGETTYIVVGFKSLKDAKRFKRKMEKKGLTSVEMIGEFKPE